MYGDIERYLRDMLEDYRAYSQGHLVYEFIDPGSGQMGFPSLEGYKMEQGSPAINSGKIIPGHPGRDFWGNPVQENQNMDRGAMESK